MCGGDGRPQIVCFSSVKVSRGFRCCCLLWVLDQCRIGSGCRIHGVASSTALTGMQNSEKSTTGVVVRSVQLHGLWSGFTSISKFGMELMCALLEFVCCTV